jgi:lipoyl(octanoyl) transferase
MSNSLVVRWLGQVPYQDAWDLQEQLAGEVAAGHQPPTLLLLEHPHTFTFGRRGQAENLLWGQEELERRGVQVYWVDRGGDVTYHGPGQLVGYPLLPLAPGGLYMEAHSGKRRLPQADYVGYLRRLEEMLIRTLFSLGVVGAQVPGLTGVWVQPDVFSRCLRCPPSMRQKPAKIAAIGVKVDAHGVSRHGFALNVDPDMTYWDGIIGCGIQDYPIASLADLLQPVPDMQQVRQAIIQAFSEEFDYQIIEEIHPFPGSSDEQRFDT